MNILLVGNCNSRGPGSWPYYLKDILDCDLVNLSIAGSGNAYIYEATISELSERPHDLVLIMWCQSTHTGIPVNDISKYADSENTSLYQSSVNDWAEKIVDPINDQDYVPKNWILNAGYNSGKTDSVAKFFKHYHQTVTYEQIVESDIYRMIGLQSFFKSTNQPYAFLYCRPYTKFKRFKNLYKLIDWSCFYQEDTLMQIASRNNNELMGSDNALPNTAGHQLYARLISQHVLKILKHR
jgi:hypothetical protein